MTLEELHQTVVEGFKRVDDWLAKNDEHWARNDERWARNDERWAQNDERWTRNDERWAQNNERWGQNGERLLSIEAQFAGLRSEIDARFREEGERTRRHFEAVAERIEASVRMVAEGHAHLMTIVGNHEVRLQTIEKRT